MGLNTVFKMYRVVALGHEAGEIVDQLRRTGIYDDIRFVFCDTESNRLKIHGRDNDEHVLLTGIAQCREAIHDDCELMAVLVTSLDEDESLKYAMEIMYELWNYADYTYCFATTPNGDAVKGKGGSLATAFNWITDYSIITVLQDNSRLPEGLDRNKGMARLLELILQHPRKGLSKDRDKSPFGVWATEKQLYMALQAVYSNYPGLNGYYDAEVFSFHKSSHKY